jgi:peptidoglycan/LPS O-acetylase OafA/YrhL
MEATKASGGRYYRPELDVVRFVAFLLVYLYHTLPSASDPRIAHLLKGLVPLYFAFCNACGYGLGLFFTLSAFLICELLLREREAAGDVGIKQFYIRRILRIWPLYYFGLALGMVFLYLPGGHPEEIAYAGWFAIFLGAWRIATLPALHPFNNPAGVLWSVSVEEQFYLFAPWGIRYLSRKSLYGFCAALLVVANALLYYFGHVSAAVNRIGANSFVQFQFFSAGILLCLVLHGRAPGIAVWKRLMLIAGCGICWMTACYGLHCGFVRASDNPGSWALIGGYALAALGCVLLLVACLGVSPRLIPAWAVYLGRISFGLYVFHEFAIFTTDHLIIGYLSAHMNPLIKSLEGPIFLLNYGLTFALTVLLAALSYRYIETPFLKMKKRHSVIESQPIAGAAGRAA